MKAEEVVSLLQSRLPKLTSSFSDSTVITSLTNPSGVQALANTSSPHGLTIGALVVIRGAESNIAISSLTRSGIVGTLVTATDHDITNGLKTIEVAGATEGQFNGSFKILNVTNRRTITFTMPDSGFVIATGSPVLVNGESPFRGYNGLQTVTSIPTPTQFTYDLQNGGLQSATGTIAVESGVRISAGGTIERIIDAYTKQVISENWLFVVLGDVTASKSRDIESDGVDNIRRAQQGDDYRQQLIQPLTIYVFLPTADQLTSRKARDECEDLFKLICQSILFHTFDSGLSIGRYGSLAFVNHGFQFYNTAFYVHQYTFEQMADLSFGDTVGFDDDTAFRDIELIMNQDTGNETFIADINLDDEALP